MTKKESKSQKAADLRKRTEKKVAKSMDSIGEMSTEEVKKLIHNLRVYQIERERQNKALRKSQMVLSTLVNSIRDEVWFADTQKKFTMMNPSAIKEFNLGSDSQIDVEELVQNLEVYRLDGSPYPVNEVPSLRALKGEVVINQEVIIRTPARGDLRYRQVSSNPVRDARGNIIGSVSVVRDITEHKLMEKKLKESETKYRIVAENTYDFEFWLNPQGQYIYASPSSMRVTGYNPEDYSKDPDLRRRIIHPDDLSIYDRHVEETENKCGDANSEWRIIHANGSIRWISHACLPIFSDKGEYLGLRGSNRDITERKRTEEALRQHTELLEHAPVLVRNLDGTIILWNKGMEKMYGFSHEEALGKMSQSLLQTRFTQPLEAIMESVYRNGQWEGELYHRRKDGTPIAVTSLWVMHSDASGKHTAVIEINNDITKRKQAEEGLSQLNAALEQRVNERATQLRAASLYSRSLIEASLDPLVTISPDGKITDVNEATVKVTGVPRDELVGTDFSDYFTEAPKAREGYRQVFAKGFVTDYPLTIRHRDGNLVDVLYNASVYRDVTGSVLGVFAAARDVTERRLVEKNLRAASLYSRSLIEASIDPLVTISADGKVMDVNRATEEVTGVTRGELIGSDFSNYFTEPEEARAGYEQVFTEGFVRDYPLVIRHTSGRVTEVLYNASKYMNESGEVQGVFAAARDVTELRHAQSELRKSYEELERRVEARTADLKEKTEQLEAANKELESFSYSVSHDLRAPLRAIDGYARMVLKKEGGKFDEDTTHKFNTIRSNAQMMGQLIDELLAFSRLSKKQLSASKLDMESIIMDVWKELQVINPVRNMTLTINSMPPGYGDRTLIKQVCSNLLANAVKFTKNHDAAHIEAGGSLENDGNIYYVKDNGVGFDMAYYDKLFGIFQRLHSTDDFEGTGVGLAMVQRIIHRHGGRVWAEGKVNEGATFYFTLPGKEERLFLKEDMQELKY
jgi:PAS domain S-box-containing protein